LKEGLGTHASSYETVCQWVNAFGNGWEETDSASRSGAPASLTDERHMEQVKSVLECTVVATEVRISSKCLLYPHQQLRETKFVLSDDQRAMCVFLSTNHLQH